MLIVTLVEAPSATTASAAQACRRSSAAEIGERLRQTLAVEMELPPSLKSLLEQLRASEDA
jgi:hypothetical protein